MVRPKLDQLDWQRRPCVCSKWGSILSSYACTHLSSYLQDYVSTWQIRDALQQNRIVPTFVLQFDGRFNSGLPPLSLTEAYQSLRADLTSIGAQVLTIDSQPQNAENVARDLISIIQTAYNVSLDIIVIFWLR